MKAGKADDLAEGADNQIYADSDENEKEEIVKIDMNDLDQDEIDTIKAQREYLKKLKSDTREG